MYPCVSAGASNRRATRAPCCGARAIRELRFVWVESLLGTAALGLALLVLLRAGYTVAGVTLAALLYW